MQAKLNKLEITVYGRIPSKKNSRNIFVRGGKLFNIPSKKYKEWHAAASLHIIDNRPAEPLDSVDKVELKLYAPDRRAADLTNKAESILDLLVDNGYLTDDNWFVINKVLLLFMGVDKENPRCEVCIYKDK